MSYRHSTSKPAYNEALLSADTCRAQVLEAIKELCKKPPFMCYDKQIARHLGWDINRVTPRRGELLTSKLVEEAGDFLNNEERRRKVAYWKMPASKPAEQATMFGDQAA